MNTNYPDLFVIGSGGYGREVMSYLDAIPSEKRDFNLKGFIDDDVEALRGRLSNHKIYGSVEGYQFKKEDMVVIAIANIEFKRQIYEKLKNKVTFYSFVSSEALIGPGVKIGKGAIICPGVKLGASLKIGKLVSVNVNSVLGHDAVIGDFCSVMPTVDVGGGAIIGNNVFLATKVTVSPLITVCDGAYLGVGSVNIKDIAEPGTYFGNPARRMR